MTTDTRPFEVIPESAVRALSSRLEGTVLLRGDTGFKEAAHIWNGMIDKVPGAIVRVGSVEDVVAAVGFAREHDIELSIKGGGHNIAGLALSDSGLTLDMSPLRKVVVDAAARTAVVQPGCTLGDVDGAPRRNTGWRQRLDSSPRQEWQV